MVVMETLRQDLFKINHSIIKNENQETMDWMKVSSSWSERIIKNNGVYQINSNFFFIFV